jgi:hypothetical protein
VRSTLPRVFVRLFYWPDGSVRWLSFCCPWIAISGLSLAGLCFVTPHSYMLAIIVFGISIVTSPISVIALIAALIRRTRRVVSIAVLACTVSATGLGMFPLASRGYDRIIAEREKESGPVIEAARQFHRDHAAYPDRIQDLVPAYLSTIAPPFQDGTLRYFHRLPDATHAEGFSVMFEGMGMQEFLWVDDKNEWHMVD